MLRATDTCRMGVEGTVVFAYLAIYLLACLPNDINFDASAV